ncbi:MAG: VWA domain-containing protein [Bdellovibrionales bacterium]|nr:VWA domain-containing protein [Bdellovibrionales bacterium]
MKFAPPELLTDSGDGAVDNQSRDDWEKAIEYHEIKHRLRDERTREKARATAIEQIIRKALATMGAVSRPYREETSPWEKNPSAELDLEASLSEDPSLESLLVEHRAPKRAEVVLCIDTSLSMTGRKLALTAVALATIALQLESEDLGVVCFETDATVIKPLGRKMPLRELLRALLEVPARGLTNIEAGLKKAALECGRGRLPRKAVILMSDGRFTAGANPEHMVAKLPRLHVVQTGSPWASPRLCRNLAKKGGGKFVRVSRWEHLPKALYSLTGEIVR